MPRPPQFDRNEALNKALDLFWSDGYEASSISKLLDTMDLNRGSLYSTFRDKRSLFELAMAQYVQNLSELTDRTLVKIPDPLEALREFFYQAFIGGDGKKANGCLLFNTITELTNTMPAIANEASDYLLEVRELFLKRLIEAKNKNMLNEDKDVDAQANFLLGVLAGFRVLCKMNFDANALKEVIDLAFSNVFKEAY